MSAVITGDQNGTVGLINAGTAVASTSGTSIDFTGIPAGVKRITVMFAGVSTNGSTGVGLRLGTVSGFETSGYAGSVLYAASTTTAASMSTMFLVANSSTSASSLLNGSIVLTLLTGNTWTYQSSMGGGDNNYVHLGGASKALGAVLTQLRVMSINGTDTFDAGSINILYE